MECRLFRTIATVALVVFGAGVEAQRAQGPKAPAASGERAEVLAVQVFLDRAGFSPGEIDGAGGANTERALAAFEREKGARVADLLASAADPATIAYTITAEDAAAPVVKAIPEDMMAKAGLKRLDYSSHLEMLGERFHASPALLRRLNPRLRIAPGEPMVVPNVKVRRPSTKPAAKPAAKRAAA